MASLSDSPRSSLPEAMGCIRLNGTYAAKKKEFAAVLARFSGVLVILAIATAVVTPPLIVWMPLWKAMAVMLGMVLIYLGGSFFLRPQVDFAVLGGRFGGLKFDKATNLQRGLVVLHFLLAPGRFAAETLLDACVLAGISQGSEEGQV